MTLSSSELSEWMAYSTLEPFGQRRSDDGFRVVASLIFNSNRGKDQRPLEPSDFLRVWEPPQPPDPEAEAAALDDFLGRLAAAS